VKLTLKPIRRVQKHRPAFGVWPACRSVRVTDWEAKLLVAAGGDEWAERPPRRDEAASEK
jgi:hypothetical protein